MRKRPCVTMISEVPNRFKCHQNAPLIVLAFIFSLQFQIVLNAARMHYLASLFSKCSLQFHIVSDAVRMHHLAFLFLKLCLQFQIVSNAVRMHHLPSLLSFFFSAVQNSFECSQNALFSILVFKFVSAVPIVSNEAPFSVLVFKMFSEVSYHIVSGEKRSFRNCIVGL